MQSTKWGATGYLKKTRSVYRLFFHEKIEANLFSYNFKQSAPKFLILKFVDHNCFALWKRYGHFVDI